MHPENEQKINKYNHFRAQYNLYVVLLLPKA